MKQYLLWNFLLFENCGQKVGGPTHCWSPNLKVGGPVSPSPYGCCAYAYRKGVAPFVLALQHQYHSASDYVPTKRLNIPQTCRKNARCWSWYVWRHLASEHHCQFPQKAALCLYVLTSARSDAACSTAAWQRTGHTNNHTSVCYRNSRHSSVQKLILL